MLKQILVGQGKIAQAKIKPVRAHAMDGAAFPHTINVKYTIDGKDYICRKWIGAGNNVPDKGTTIKVTYWEDKPSKARIEL